MFINHCHEKYQFQIVRYIHDRITGEFVNVGIIVYMPESRFLKSRFINKFSRISQFFIDVNGHSLLGALKQFDKEINIVSKDYQVMTFLKVFHLSKR
ncbi:MAG: DUF3037 domain-containing protein [Chitinophagaceae bacterium]|nr:DUF3037 domain-containing protein [Chitinophagaceae bacterium]